MDTNGRRILRYRSVWYLLTPVLFDEYSKMEAAQNVVRIPFSKTHSIRPPKTQRYGDRGELATSCDEICSTHFAKVCPLLQKPGLWTSVTYSFRIQMY